MNIERLRQVRDKIRNSPRHFNMHQGITLAKFSPMQRPVPTVPVGEAFNECGTVACIAGWTVILIEPEAQVPFSFTLSNELNWMTISERARQILGLTPQQADDLFHLSDWPANWANEFYSARSDKDRARIAARRLTDFIRKEIARTKEEV